ncbi:hypothetical protein A3J90_07750 [candidate division WOR-1 bacterium RIFOXYC2_FULL_37_10]|uniref:Uncharacterized protein n=1 Tax=candidate division WOR-1 bacterium RIFOXYB2_FULL_37_13 TaxID=1802579 RepID=A0A1F4SFZ0_UNCSA|nr:MAG: hypothetical protein A2310_03360 [candidate division WOR-1 bacterium RIFOXYB2_FULL_37_13]OGC32426.1 MAG: hypothetical protein A3J90_07750 [candidate division WOR-1 bacterium RIFOXYC2_FULL_37_10]
MDSKKRIFLVILILLLALSIWFVYTKINKTGLSASGTIEATEITVSSKIMGKVLDVKVDQGSDVKKGDILAVIDAKEIDEALKSARAKYKLAEIELDRTKKLYNKDAASRQQYDTAKSNLDIAEAAFETAKIQVDNAFIRSPISGTVLVKAIESGELAAIGTPISILADLTKVNLIVYLPEKDIGKAILKGKVDVSVDAYPSEKFTGEVTYISDKAEFTPKSIQTKDERTKQVFGIKIEIPNPDKKLKPGMPADAGFTWNSQ